MRKLLKGWNHADWILVSSLAIALFVLGFFLWAASQMTSARIEYTRALIEASK